MPLRQPRHALVGLACCAVLAAGCSQPSAAVPAGSPSPAAPSPSAGPSPSPEPPPPVNGAVTLSAIHLSVNGRLVYSPGSTGDRPPAVDEPAVKVFVGNVDRWLDVHLTALQSGEVPELPTPLDAAAAPAASAAVTTALTSPETPVASATYDTEVALDGGPRWAHVRVTVERLDGTTATADFVFVPTPDGPQLVAAGPAGEVSP